MAKATTTETADESVAPAEAEATAESKTPKKEETGVQYIGGADVKILRVEDLASVGVADAVIDLRWDSQNDHIIGVSDVNAATLEYLRSQPDFRII